jgi:hypothetical protein
MKAYCLIREAPWYRRAAFVDGLRAVGHEVLVRQPDKLDRDTAVIMWNRYASNHDLACRVEAAGGTVIIAENGYIGRGGGTPKFDVHPGGPQPHHYYAIAPRFHNDSMTVPSLGPAPSSERLRALQIELKPWRSFTGPGYILVCPNRSFGIPGRVMPVDWAENRARKLRKRWPGVEVRVRAHPGNNAPKRTLADDLAGARAVYVWSSSCGVHALAEGIPVVCDAPYWILKGAAMASDGALECDEYPDRQPHFERLACAQYSCEEIERGTPFSHLLRTAGQG